MSDHYMSSPHQSPSRDDVDYQDEEFPALRLARSSRIVRSMGKTMLLLLLVSFVAMFFVPWMQSIRGEGAVVALDPYERPQDVEAPVEGRIGLRGEGVYENAYVTKGQVLFEIVDINPDYLIVLQRQLSAAMEGLRVAKSRREQAELLIANNQRIVDFTLEELEYMKSARDELVKAYDQFVKQAENKLLAERSKLHAAEAKRIQAEEDFERRKRMFDRGAESEYKFQIAEQLYLESVANVKIAEQNIEIAENGVRGKQNERQSKSEEWEAKVKKIDSNLEKARIDLDKWKLDVKKIEEEIQKQQTEVQEYKNKFERQQSQIVKAPRDGYIMELAVVDDATFVKKGARLCRIVPRMTSPAVQIWVSGNDAPLIHEGDPVRLQFEGWPAVQFSGWPSVAAGTFGGRVKLVDPTDNGLGRFRVVVVPDPQDEKWPEHPYLRQGVRSNGWVLLDNVPLGYEIWRRMNGFPPALESKKDVDKEVKPPKISM